MLPPPAPISIMSMEGCPVGIPLPSHETVFARRLHGRRDSGLAVLDQADLRGGAAHVERQHVAVTGEPSEICGRDAAARGPGLSIRTGKRSRHLRRGQAAG